MALADTVQRAAGWRWTPCLALGIGSLSFALLAIALVPSELSLTPMERTAAMTDDSAAAHEQPAATTPRARRASSTLPPPVEDSPAPEVAPPVAQAPPAEQTAPESAQAPPQVQCVTQCQNAFQSCMSPRGVVPDLAKCQAELESCRMAC